MNYFLSEALIPVLANLRAQYFIYQTAHWQTNGHAFYGNHLLFQRLYEGVAENVDALAEKMVGLNGNEAVNPTPILQMMASFVKDWEESYSCPFERAFQAETELQSWIKKAYDGQQIMGGMTLGLDDFLMSLANKHEENMYLIQQVFTDNPVDRMASWTFCEVGK